MQAAGCRVVVGLGRAIDGGHPTTTAVAAHTYSLLHMPPTLCQEMYGAIYCECPTGTEVCGRGLLAGSDSRGMCGVPYPYDSVGDELEKYDALT